MIAGTRIAPICDTVDDKWFARGGGHFLDICNYGPSVLSANWPQGTLASKEPYYLYRYYLQAGDRFGRQALLFDMVQRLKSDNIAEFNIYGTGDLAEALLLTAWLHGLQVRYLIPRPGAPMPRPWGAFEAADLPHHLGGGAIVRAGGQFRWKLDMIGPGMLGFQPRLARKEAERIQADHVDIALLGQHIAHHAGDAILAIAQPACKRHRLQNRHVGRIRKLAGLGNGAHDVDRPEADDFNGGIRRVDKLHTVLQPFTDLLSQLKASLGKRKAS